MRTLYWLTDDLRIRDNPALTASSSSDTLTCVFCIDDQWFRTDKFGNRMMGPHRWRFLRESLIDLQHQFSELGQTLHLVEGAAAKKMSALLETGLFDRVVRSRRHAPDPDDAWRVLSESFTNIRFEQYDSGTLFKKSALPFGGEFPATFSGFRRRISGRPFRSLQQAPVALPEPSSADLDGRLIESPVAATGRRGGESEGHRRLSEYFSTRAASTYKATRNALQGDNFSTGLSAWLSLGCLSPVQVFEAVRRYESLYGENESTQWIVFELLWREFFRWYGDHHGGKLFDFTGVNGSRPLTSFYEARFRKWRDGRTPWPIVNACMAELRETGELSNRGRQIAASCLVNELGLDWRCGAGYFQEMLVDLDVCSNWGNWQYIAGVGADPRGGRHFNLDWQGDAWDADGAYRQRWAGLDAPSMLDDSDYYGWPAPAKLNESS